MTMIILVLMMMILTLMITRNLFILLFGQEFSRQHKKRLKQLRFENKEDKDDAEETRAFINKITEPVITHLFPHIKLMKNLDELERDLAVTKWNRYFTPTSFIATDIVLKAIGVLIGLVVTMKVMFLGIIWFVILFFGFTFLFNNELNERKAKLMSGFPEFIQITQGYLGADMPFSQAVEQTIPYVGEEWRDYLKEFVINCDIRSVEEALDVMRGQIDVFEIREMLNIIRLNLQQGADIKESLASQADKVKELQYLGMMQKIEKRKNMTIMLQAPLLLTLIMAFGLPVIQSMMFFSSM